MNSTTQDDEPFSDLALPEEQNSEEFPALRSLSAAFFYQFLPIPETSPPPPEYVHVPIPPRDFKTLGWVASWNMAWEAGPLRFNMFNEEDVPAHLRKLDRYEGHDLRLVPDGPSSDYTSYALLYHLLPLDVLRRFELPPLRPGMWPTMVEWRPLPLGPKFKERFAHALAVHIWPFLSQKPKSAFSPKEPTVLLAHDLDFWLPLADQVVQARLRACDRVRPKDAEQEALLIKAQEDARQRRANYTPQLPLFGGEVWCGVEDARDATQEMVALADGDGRLQAILDAIQSHRAEDDFSPRWSRVREDFERKLYHKRAKVKVSFVELPDTVPVHGPEAEVEAEQIWQNLFATLDRRERRVVVCLRSGTTRVGDIAQELGYANHSPVSKMLDRIRQKAAKLLR